MDEENDDSSFYEDAYEAIEDDSVGTSGEMSSEEQLANDFESEGDTPEIARLKAHLIKLETWKGIHFYSLPDWMQDNDFLHKSHRPQLQSYAACFKSIFSIHSETGNIWTHLLGCVIFLIIAIYYLTRPEHEIQWEDKFVLIPFFVGAIGCMALSFTFHTFYVHSEHMSKFFLKLDYIGISLLQIGSFIPWCFYAFYCHPKTKFCYITMLSLMCSGCVYLSSHDEFMTVPYRPYRAALFIAFGFTAALPALHLISVFGFSVAFFDYSLAWLFLMGVTYCVGAFLYVCRIPERFFPGQCDIWFQSHQIFHLFVVLAAFIHYHGISELAERKINKPCEDMYKY